jgi:hypothetical protein
VCCVLCAVSKQVRPTQHPAPSTQHWSEATQKGRAMVETIITAKSEPILSDEILARCMERGALRSERCASRARRNDEHADQP